MNSIASQPVQSLHGATPRPHDGGATFTAKKPGKLLRLPRVVDITALGKSSIYAGVKSGAFPAPVRLSARAVGWREDSLDRWVSERLTIGGVP